MKKFVKIMLSVGLCLVVFGGLLMGCGILVGATPVELVNGGNWNITIANDRGDNQWQKDNRYLISAGAVCSIDVDWVSGDITIEPWDGEEICLEESSSAPITEKTHLIYRVDDDTLEIDFCAEKLGISFGGTGLESKKLKILVPRQIALDEISLDVVSSDVTVKNLCAHSVSVDSVSGSLLPENLNADYIALDTVSGNLKGSFRSCPQELDMDSVSGSVEITLPEDSRFQVRLDSVSGRYSSDLPNWNDADSYFQMDTASGDFIVRKAPGTADTQPEKVPQQSEEATEPAQTTEPTQSAQAADPGSTI